MRVLLLAFVLVAASASLPAKAADIHLLASVAMKAAFDTLIPTFEARSGDKVVTQYSTSTAVAKLVESGTGFDVAVSTAGAIDALIRNGVLLADPHPVVGATVASLAYRTGTPAPDIRTEDAFKAVVLAAPAISSSDPAQGGASANYFLALTTRLGIADAVRPKLIVTKPGEGAAPVAAGTALYGVALSSEIAGTPGTSGVPIFPADPASTTTLSAGVSSKAAQPAAARALIAFLLSPDAIAVRKAKGLATE